MAKRNGGDRAPVHTGDAVGVRVDAPAVDVVGKPARRPDPARSRSRDTRVPASSARPAAASTSTMRWAPRRPLARNSSATVQRSSGGRSSSPVGSDRGAEVGERRVGPHPGPTPPRPSHEMGKPQGQVGIDRRRLERRGSGSTGTAGASGSSGDVGSSGADPPASGSERNLALDHRANILLDGPRRPFHRSTEHRSKLPGRSEAHVPAETLTSQPPLPLTSGQVQVAAIDHGGPASQTESTYN